MTLETRYRRSSGMASRQIRGEHILVPISSASAALDSIFALNPTAGLIWQRACAGENVQSIANHIAHEFEIDASTAEADAQKILTELVEIGALEIES